MRHKIKQIYVMFMLLLIAHHNKIRMKFEKRHEEFFGDYGQDLEHMQLIDCFEKDGKLYKKDKENAVAVKPHRDDLGLYEYVHQVNDFEDSYYGTIYTKTPFKNKWLARSFEC